MSMPVATIKAYRRTGGPVVTVERQGQPPHRYRISLKRYHALRQWAAFGGHPWKTSGSYMRNSLTISLWAGNDSSLNQLQPQRR